MSVYMALIACTALVAALNPVTFSVLIMSMASLFGKEKHPRHVAAHATLFALGIFVVQAAVGLLCILVLRFMPIEAKGYVGIFAALALCISGLLETKDYFWYGKGVSFTLSKKAEKTIHSWTKKHHSLIRGLGLGVYTGLRLGHYTLVMVISVAILSSILLPANIFVPVIWSFWYILPMLLMVALLLSGATIHSLLSWKEQSKHTMRLSTGLLYIFMGWLILVQFAGGLKLL